MQVGGGINADNAMNYLEEGASHVIVTSVCIHLLACRMFAVRMFAIQSYSQA